MPLNEKTNNFTLSVLHSSSLTDLEKTMPFITDEPKIPSYVCFPSKVATEKYFTKDIYGQGFSENDKLARIKSVAECLERLCLFNPQPERFVFSPYSKNCSFIDPFLFCYYSDQQLPNIKEFLQQSKEGLYNWWPSIDLISKNKVLLPAQILFLSKHFDEEFPLRKEKISTGAALGIAANQSALRNGFFEVVERDSCMFSYLTQRNIKKIVNLPPELNNLVEYLERYRLEPNIFDITTDLNIPSILAVVYDRSGIGVAVNIGSKSDCKYFDAIKRALLESIQCRVGSRLNQRLSTKEEITTNNINITTIEERYRYWSYMERIKDLESWLSKADKADYSCLTRKDITFEQAVQQIEKRRYHIFVADISLPELRGVGIETLKVVIPELHPLYINEKAKVLYSIHHGIILDDAQLKPHPFS